MAQAYRTTYSTHYRWNDNAERTKSLPPHDEFAESLPAGDHWIVSKNGVDEDESDYDVVAKFYEKLRRTTYQNHYCKTIKPYDDDDHTNNALLEYGEDLYSSKQIKVLPPLPTARRIYGFLSPKRMATPLTTYQKQIGKLGYSLLTENTKKDASETSDEPKKPKLNVESNEKNYKVSANGRELTINRWYDAESGKFMCMCK